MKTITVSEPINLKVVRFELDFSSLAPEQHRTESRPKKPIKLSNELLSRRRPSVIPSPPRKEEQKQDVKELVEVLLDDLYADHRDWTSNSYIEYGQGSTSAPSFASSHSFNEDHTNAIERSYLENLDLPELYAQRNEWEEKLQITGERLARCVRVKDRLKRHQKRLCAAFTVLLRHIRQMSAIINSLRNLAGSSKTNTAGDSSARFGLTAGEGPGEGGFAEWLHAMRLVARLPAGVPQHFRRKLWLTLADRHLTARGVDWSTAGRACFRGTAQPDDTELGAQILKDLHRTGCSLFCGTEGRENQAMLRRVLLAYARWNKDVGYCQGFNMLAAIILEVMDKSESESLKVMIYLVEAVLPEGYFADDLRGLSADMAAFRDLLRLRIPRLAQHMDHLQRISDGGGVEPPLPDVFTMQWFLTLYATWLPRDTLLRIWDLILLDGNEILLLTALAIWDMLQDRILSTRSADEFYSCMGGGAGAVWEAADSLLVRVVAFGSVPELPKLRSLHRYRVAPPAPPASAPTYQPPLHSAVQSMTKKGLRLFYSEDEGDSSDDGNKMALATVMPRYDKSAAGDRLSLDIGALKRQYARLRERQRQAHVILAAACARHAAVGVPTSPTSLTVNNLLLGKSAIVSSRGRRLGPPPGAVPPSRQSSSHEKSESQSSGKTNDTLSWKEEISRKTLSRRNSVKWKDIKKEKADRIRKASIDLDETGDGIIVSEREANEIVASLRTRSSSESSSYSSRSASSTDTSLCDDNERVSDSEPDIPEDRIKNKISNVIKESVPSPSTKDFEVVQSPLLSESFLSQMPETDDVKEAIDLKPVKDISEYLGSAAGEPLRTYIDGFESQLKNSLIVSSDSNKYIPTSPFKNVSPYSQHPRSESDVIQRLSLSKVASSSKSNESIKSLNMSSVKPFTNLSPIDLSPCQYGFSEKTPCDYDFVTKCKQPSIPKPDLISRPPDIIDSLTIYPNFVPDIDLSEKNISDIDSPPRSPGAESIIVSEDEPPIPLKIDKYFEHSPEFFGARVTDPNATDIPNRRSSKRNARISKKPDSLTLQTNHNDKILKDEVERASSLPQSHSFTERGISSPNIKINDVVGKTEEKISTINTEDDTVKEFKNIQEKKSPKGYILRSGRQNSERALQIIQENSKILSRILTKQNNTENLSSRTTNPISFDKTADSDKVVYRHSIPEQVQIVETKSIESPLLKESTSDSLIGYINKNVNSNPIDKNDFVKIRPISIDDPFSLDSRITPNPKGGFDIKSTKSPSVESLGNKTDLYGWENKGFLAKCEFRNLIDKSDVNDHKDLRRKTYDFSIQNSNSSNVELKPETSPEWSRHSFSCDTKTLLSSEQKDAIYDHKYTSDDYNYPFSSKYNDYVLSKASDICSKTVDQGPKICENMSKKENSLISDFSHVVTSSISFTYEPSVDDDSPIGAKSNSSDTLCQIASLDQVSTPISPKIFLKETPTHSKEISDRSEKPKLESDDTCSAITSLNETETLSSLSYPRSPSTGSYHPFPTRPAMRLPKELGIRLGMYPKDSISSPQK